MILGMTSWMENSVDPGVGDKVSTGVKKSFLGNKTYLKNGKYQV